MAKKIQVVDAEPGKFYILYGHLCMCIYREVHDNLEFHVVGEDHYYSPGLTIKVKPVNIFMFSK